MIITIDPAMKESVRASCSFRRASSQARGASAAHGLPDIPYPVPETDLKSALLDNGDLPLAAMLPGLQQRSRDGEVEWQQIEPAMDWLAELLAPDDARDVVSAAGDHW